MDKYIKRIQSRLTSLKITFQGRTVPMWMVRQYYEVIASDRYNPTEEDLTNVIEAIKAKVQEPDPAIETEAIAPVTQEITQAQELTSEIQEPKSEESSLTMPENSSQIAQAPVAMTISSNVTQAISQAVAQVGASGNQEAIELLTSLANELSTDIKDVQEMASALITAYLGKRQNILASAIGTVQTLRSAQTNSFQAGLDQDFFAQKDQAKRQFLNNLQGLFN